MPWVASGRVGRTDEVELQLLVGASVWSLDCVNVVVAVWRFCSYFVFIPPVYQKDIVPNSRRVTFMVHLLWHWIPRHSDELEKLRFFFFLRSSVRFSELLTVWRCHSVEVSLFLNPDSAGTFLLGLLAAVTEFRYETFYVAESSLTLQE